MVEYSRALQDRARGIVHRCRVLAAHSETPGAITRTFLSNPMRAVHADVRAWMTAASMTVSIDAAGNIRGLYPASTPGAPRLYIGSHLDTVPNGGAFDGVLGVMLGIALVDHLDGRRLPFDIEVIGFAEEEGVRFGVPFIGSRALAGTIDDDLLVRCDRDGVSVADVIRRFGLDPARLPVACAAPGALGYLEVHIEQGPALESLGHPIGVVSAISGQTRATITFCGQAAHAGTTPMPERRDALAAAAEWITEVEREAQATPGMVATVGRLDVAPGVGNVIAGRVLASLDIRHEIDAVRESAVRRLRLRAEHLSARRHVSVLWQTDLDQPAVAMSPALVAALARAVGQSGAPVHHMPSGAGHDAMIMASVMPTAMLFVRSPGGLSHHPDEIVLDDDVAAALAAARAFVDDLAEPFHA